MFLSHFLTIFRVSYNKNTNKMSVIRLKMRDRTQCDEHLYHKNMDVAANKYIQRAM